MKNLTPHIDRIVAEGVGFTDGYMSGCVCSPSRAGLMTGLIGKWHLGYPDEFHPNERGFDCFYGFLQGSRKYFPTPNVRVHRVIMDNRTSDQAGQPALYDLSSDLGEERDVSGENGEILKGLLKMLNYLGGGAPRTSLGTWSSRGSGEAQEGEKKKA